MAEGVNFVLVRTVFGAVLGMFYFGFNTGVVNAPAASIKQFTNSSYHQHYDSWLSGDKVETIFTVITSAFIGTASSHHTIQCNIMFPVGGMVGAMVGGRVADRVGRKKGLLLSQVKFRCRHTLVGCRV